VMGPDCESSRSLRRFLYRELGGRPELNSPNYEHFRTVAEISTQRQSIAKPLGASRKSNEQPA